MAELTSCLNDHYQNFVHLLFVYVLVVNLFVFLVHVVMKHVQVFVQENQVIMDELLFVL